MTTPPNDALAPTTDAQELTSDNEPPAAYLRHEQLLKTAQASVQNGQPQAAMSAYQAVLAREPSNSFALVGLGMLEMEGSSDMTQMERAVSRFELALSREAEPRVSIDSQIGYDCAVRIGWFRMTRHQHAEGERYLRRASSSKHPHDDGWDMFLAATVPNLTTSQKDEVARIEYYHTAMDAILAKPKLSFSRAGHFSSTFQIAYYDTDQKTALAKWAALHMKAIPGLVWESPLLAAQPWPDPDKRKIRVGFLSSFFKRESSVWGGFGPTINRLPREVFEVVLIYYPRSPISQEDRDLSASPENDIYLEKFGEQLQGVAEARAAIVEKQLDILMYLDLFMSPELHLIAVARLAPVQVYSFGHPVTTGIPRNIMTYFLSWAAAELPEAQENYTEELVLLPADTPWHYAEPRNTPEERSLISKGAPWGHITRADMLDFFSKNAMGLTSVPDANALMAKQEVLGDPASHWYFTAQPPFKFQHVFDKIFLEIQKKDPNAVLVFVDSTALMQNTSYLQKAFETRLQDESGIDLSRVVFFPRMQHYELMAMYKHSDVVLDSWPFGGETTTREAFETAALIVTLPDRRVAGRFTQAHYKIMGVHDLIASDAEDFVKLAVGVATNKARAHDLRERIKANSHKLFRSTDAIDHWTRALVGMATKNIPNDMRAGTSTREHQEAQHDDL